MVRSFSDLPLDAGLVEEMLVDALRSPTAGNTGGTAWILLEGSEQTATYWAHTTTEDWRRRSRRWPGLSRAPVVALSLASPAAYVRRYGESDKARSGLGPPVAWTEPDAGGPAGRGGEDRWPVPYWFGDAAFATMALLLRATTEGLGACFLGNFRGEDRLLPALAVPDEWRLFGTVLLGRPAGADPPSPSLARRGVDPSARIHRGRW
jgi:nitroreductase